MKTIEIIFVLIIVCLLNFNLNAQVKVGDNHTTVNPNSLLELESTDKGLLLPRLALTSTTSASPLTAHVLGMFVYNTATAGSGNTAVTPGIYFNTGSQWYKVEITMNGNPVSTIIATASTNTPNGYLYCDGSAVSRTTYATLFASIGTTYGAGDGSTTFNLPDYRGYFLRGQSNGSGNDPDAASRTNSGNGTAGDNIGTKQTGQIQSHTHTQQYGTGGTVYASSNPASTYYGNNQWTNDHAGTFSGVINASGGNETRPKNINVRYYIKF